MDKPTIKGNEVRQGRHIILDALSKRIIDSLEDRPLSEKTLSQLNDGTTPIFPQTAVQITQSYKEKGELVFAIRLLDDKSCIGCCRFSNINWQARHAQLFIAIFSDDHFSLDILVDVIQTLLQFAYWEANLNRIFTHTLEDNTLMIEALQHSGFINEGRFRHEAYRDGRYLDIYAFSILQKDWAAT